MLLYSTIALLFILRSVSYFTSMTKLSTNIQTGTKELTLTSMSTGSSPKTNSFDITYQNTYATTPKVMVTAKGFLNCKNGQYLWNFYSPNSYSSTTYRIYIYYYTYAGYFDPIITMRMNYLVFDSNSNLNMQMKTRGFNSSTSTLSDITTWTGGQLNPISTYVGCFLNSILCFYSSSIFNLKTSCQILDSSRVLYTLTTTATKANDCTAYQNHYTILVVYPDNSLILNYNTLQIINGNPSSVSINPTQSDSIYLIGLSGFRTLTGCILIMLDNNDVELDTTRSSSYLDVFFNYVQIAYKNDPVSLNNIIWFPYQVQVHFEYTNLEKYSILSTITPTFTSQLIYSTKVDNIIKTTLLTNINTNQIKMDMTITNHLYTYLISTTTAIIIADLITVNVVQRTLDVQFFNLIQVPSLTDFDSSIGGLTKNQITVMGTKKVLNIKFQRQVIGVPFYLNYLSSFTLSKTSQYLIIPTISLIETSATSISSSMSINSIPNSMSVLVSQFAWVSTNVNSQIFHTVNSNGIIKTTFNYLLTAKTSPLVVSYKPQAISDFKVILSMKLVTVKSLEIVVGQGICKLIFMNAAGIEEAVSQDFATTLASLGVSWVQQDGNDVKAVLKYDASHVGQNFQASFSPATGVYKATSTDLKIVERYVKLDADIYGHWINFTLKNVQGVSSLPIITLSHGYMSVDNVKLINDLVIISTKFSRTVDGDWLSISYEIDSSTIYYETITLELYHTFPLTYCIADFEQEAQTYKYLSGALVILFWVTFLIACFLCQKIYAVELLLALQFAYVSLIPIGVYCPPFTSLELLKYSYGWNGIPFPLAQNRVSVYYSAVSIQSNFLSNVNFMLFVPLLLSISLYFVLTKMAKKSTHFKIKPRLLKYGKSFLLDIPFAVVLLNSSNICLSFVVSAQTFGIKNVFSFLSSLIVFLILPTTIILFCVYKEKFNEFRMQFCDRLQICGASIQKSTKIRQLYPILILLEIMLLSFFSSIQAIFNASLYIDLVIIVSVSIVVVVVCPYNNKLDNIRLFIHRFLLLLICLLQIGFKKLRDQYSDSGTIFPWFFLFVLILMSTTLNIPYIIYKGIIWVKQKGTFDQNLKRQNIALQLPRNSNQLLYPALEYSRFRNRAQRDLFDINNGLLNRRVPDE